MHIGVKFDVMFCNVMVIIWFSSILFLVEMTGDAGDALEKYALNDKTTCF